MESTESGRGSSSRVIDAMHETIALYLVSKSAVGGELFKGTLISSSVRFVRTGVVVIDDIVSILLEYCIVEKRRDDRRLRRRIMGARSIDRGLCAALEDFVSKEVSREQTMKLMQYVPLLILYSIPQIDVRPVKAKHLFLDRRWRDEFGNKKL